MQLLCSLQTYEGVKNPVFFDLFQKSFLRNKKKKGDLLVKRRSP